LTSIKTTKDSPAPLSPLLVKRATAKLARSMMTGKTRPGQVKRGGKVKTSISIIIVGALTAIFVSMKLAGVISWSLLWVLAPLWIGAICGAIFLFLILVFLYYWIKLFAR